MKYPLFFLLGLAVHMTTTGTQEMMTCSPTAACLRLNSGCMPLQDHSNCCPKERVPQVAGCPSNYGLCPAYNESNVNGELNITAVLPYRDCRYFTVNVSWEHLNLPGSSDSSHWRYELKLYESIELLHGGAERCVCSSSWKTWATITAYYTTTFETTRQRNLLLLLYENETLRYSIHKTFAKPNNCREFVPLNPQQCPPSTYSEVRNITYDKSKINDGNQTQVSLSWIAPQENDRYQISSLTYFITVTRITDEQTTAYFKTNMTNIVITPLDNNANYSCIIQTQVPCALLCSDKAEFIVDTHEPPDSSHTPSTSAFPSHTPSSSPFPGHTHDFTSQPSTTPLIPVRSTNLGSVYAVTAPVVCMLVAVIVVALLSLQLRRNRKVKAKHQIHPSSTTLATTSDDTKFTGIEAPFIIETSSDTPSSSSSEQTQNVIVIYSPRTNDSDTNVILGYLVHKLGSGEYGPINSTFYQHDRTSVRKNAADWLDSKLSEKCTMLVVCNDKFSSDWNTGEEVNEISDELSLIFTFKRIITGRMCYNKRLDDVGVVFLYDKDSRHVPTFLKDAARKFLITDLDDIARFINNETKYISSN